jgi:Na+-transporting NADH:ubiquinone oxidoreductase subunit NqrB
MGIMMLVVLVALFAAVFLGVSALRRDQLPPSSPEADRLLRQQAERIDELETQLRLLQEQADFTEKLLSERNEKTPGELPPGDSP